MSIFNAVWLFPYINERVWELSIDGICTPDKPICTRLKMQNTRNIYRSDFTMAREIRNSVAVFTFLAISLPFVKTSISYFLTVILFENGAHFEDLPRRLPDESWTSIAENRMAADERAHRLRLPRPYKQEVNEPCQLASIRFLRGWWLLLQQVPHYYSKEGMNRYTMRDVKSFLLDGAGRKKQKYLRFITFLIFKRGEAVHEGVKTRASQKREHHKKENIFITVIKIVFFFKLKRLA